MEQHMVFVKWSVSWEHWNSAENMIWVHSGNMQPNEMQQQGFSLLAGKECWAEYYTRQQIHNSSIVKWTCFCVASYEVPEIFWCSLCSSGTSFFLWYTPACIRITLITCLWPAPWLPAAYSFSTNRDNLKVENKSDAIREATKNSDHTKKPILILIRRQEKKLFRTLFVFRDQPVHHAHPN